MNENTFPQLSQTGHKAENHPLAELSYTFLISSNNFLEYVSKIMIQVEKWWFLVLRIKSKI